MPSHNRQNIDDQIYEAMRMGKGVPFTFSTGGVKYNAVFQHKEAFERESLSRTNSDMPASFEPGLKRSATDEGVGGSKR